MRPPGRRARGFCPTWLPSPPPSPPDPPRPYFPIHVRISVASRAPGRRFCSLRWGRAPGPPCPTRARPGSFLHPSPWHRGAHFRRRRGSRATLLHTSMGPRPRRAGLLDPSAPCFPAPLSPRHPLSDRGAHFRRVRAGLATFLLTSMGWGHRVRVPWPLPPESRCAFPSGPGLLGDVFAHLDRAAPPSLRPARPGCALLPFAAPVTLLLIEVRISVASRASGRRFCSPRWKGDAGKGSGEGRGHAGPMGRDDAAALTPPPTLAAWPTPSTPGPCPDSPCGT